MKKLAKPEQQDMEVILQNNLRPENLSNMTKGRIYKPIQDVEKLYGPQ